jgi:hypothetical protein
MTPSRAPSLLIRLGLAVGLAALLGHRWLALGWDAFHYPTAAPTARTQVIVDNGRAYLAAGADGIEVVDLATQKRRIVLPPGSPARPWK